MATRTAAQTYAEVMDGPGAPLELDTPGAWLCPVGSAQAVEQHCCGRDVEQVAAGRWRCTYVHVDGTRCTAAAAEPGWDGVRTALVVTDPELQVCRCSGLPHARGIARCRRPVAAGGSQPRTVGPAAAGANGYGA